MQNIGRVTYTVHNLDQDDETFDVKCLVCGVTETNALTLSFLAAHAHETYSPGDKVRTSRAMWDDKKWSKRMIDRLHAGCDPMTVTGIADDGQVIVTIHHDDGTDSPRWPWPPEDLEFDERVR